MSPRRMPTKADLLRLQRLYRTDKRIAEAMGGGVTEHLITYWRRKKDIPKYNLPKFSKNEIQEVWDRFGDDFHAGLELGISKAAYYNWRRRYKITQKPEALKLEQLSLELFTRDNRGKSHIGSGRQTIIQKILSHHIGQKEIEVGTEIDFEPDNLFVCENADEVIFDFKKLDLSYVWNPSRIMVVLEDDWESHNGSNPGGVRRLVRDFVRLQKINNFFDIGSGSPHQLIVEKGLSLPGQLSLGCSSHVMALGSMGAVALYVSEKDMAGIWASGSYRFTVPDTIRVIISGRLPKSIFAGDIAQHVIMRLRQNGIENKIVEFYGSAIEQMSISERQTLCTLMHLSGALSVVCPYDAVTRRYLNTRAKKPFTPILADRNAVYTTEYTLDVNRMKPVATDTGELDKMVPIEDIEGIVVQVIFMGGRTGGRLEDFKIAAEILKGRDVSPEVKLFIQPASQAVYLEATKKGLIRAFLEKGCIILNPGFCYGNALAGYLSEDEKGLATDYDVKSSNNNCAIYYVSPATAVASAISGQITNPSDFIKI
ncbi:MAG: hypothetical protein KAR42_05550 [candidate division Zixibacteria bacterium]|nr:hypothetical protein [candidate division Zixibacteria bacterium]